MKHIFFSAVILFFFSFTLAQAAGLNQEAPDFSLKDYNGKKYTLSDFKGKFVVLEWVNFGCPFVQKHYGSGHMQKLQKEYIEKGVVWLSICSSAEGRQGYYPADELAKVTKAEGVNSTAYLIDETGEVGK
ncbi:MAG: redoxin domain-containing protein, partial [Calditrichaceae bacterium]